MCVPKILFLDCILFKKNKKKLMMVQKQKTMVNMCLLHFVFCFITNKAILTGFKSVENENPNCAWFGMVGSD